MRPIVERAPPEYEVTPADARPDRHIEHAVVDLGSRGYVHPAAEVSCVADRIVRNGELLRRPAIHDDGNRLIPIHGEHACRRKHEGELSPARLEPAPSAWTTAPPAEGKHVEEHTLGGKAIVTDEAHMPHVDHPRVLSGHPRTRVFERLLAQQGARKVAAGPMRNHAEDRIRRRRPGTVEKAASDFVDGSVTAHGDEELEAGGEGLASQGRRVVGSLGEGVLDEPIERPLVRAMRFQWRRVDPAADAGFTTTNVRGLRPFICSSNRSGENHQIENAPKRDRPCGEIFALHDVRRPLELVSRLAFGGIEKAAVSAEQPHQPYASLAPRVGGVAL